MQFDEGGRGEQEAGQRRDAGRRRDAGQMRDAGQRKIAEQAEGIKSTRTEALRNAVNAGTASVPALLQVTLVIPLPLHHTTSLTRANH